MRILVRHLHCHKMCSPPSQTGTNIVPALERLPWHIEISSKKASHINQANLKNRYQTDISFGQEQEGKGHFKNRTCRSKLRTRESEELLLTSGRNGHHCKWIKVTGDLKRTTGNSQITVKNNWKVILNLSFTNKCCSQEWNCSHIQYQIVRQTCFAADWLKLRMKFYLSLMPTEHVCKEVHFNVWLMAIFDQYHGDVDLNMTNARPLN